MSSLRNRPLIDIRLIGIATKKIYGSAHAPNTPRCIIYFLACQNQSYQQSIFVHLHDVRGMMSLYYSHLSRRIPAISKSCHCPGRTQLLSRLARNISSSTRPYVRPYVNRRSLQCAIRSRYSSTDASTAPHNSPPVPVQHRKILVEETSVAPREDTDSAIPPLPPTSISLHADTLPISCPGCGAYAQTIDSNEPGFYSRTRKKAKQLWHKKQQAIVKEQRAISSQDGEGTDDGATGSDPLDKAGKLPCRMPQST